jgi:hypothetical protein
VDLGRLRLGEVIAGAAGIALLVVMFLPWYGPNAQLGMAAASAGHRLDHAFSAWEAFGILDILLLATALAAIVVAVLAGTQRSVALPVAASVVVTALGIFVTLLVLYRLVNEPLGPDSLTDIRFGAYLGLGLCALIALGGFLSMQEEGTTLADIAPGLASTRPGPAIRTCPAPPRSASARRPPPDGARSAGA